MEYAKVTRILSRKLNENIVVYSSLRKTGYVHKFYNTKGDEYRCCRCKELEKYRGVCTIPPVTYLTLHP